MDEQEIRDRILRAKGLKDIISLVDEMGIEDMGNQYRSMSVSQWYAYVNLGRYSKYNIFEIPKKTGGTRLISSPKSPSYLQALKYINKILLCFYKAPSCTNGFVPGKSIVSNALPHRGKKYVLNVDIQDFFSSISDELIVKTLIEEYNFTFKIAKIITSFCCLNRYAEKIGLIGSCLPQGAPTSPTISNIVCLNLDRDLETLAEKNGLIYSRYADDITFSSNKHFWNKGFIKKLFKSIKGHHFTINLKKVRYQKKDIERQEVTGLVLSGEKVNVPRSYVREIRNLLYIWEKYGINAAQKSQQLFSVTHARRNTHADISNVIDGKLNYLKMVKGDNDAVYVKLKARYERLINPQLTKSHAPFFEKVKTIMNFIFVHS